MAKIEQTLEDEYKQSLPTLNRFAEGVNSQLLELLSQRSISLGVPIESRIKSWRSLSDKMERRQMQVGKLNELTDLVGIRLILLFRRDLESACQAIEGLFTIQSKEDTSKRLGEMQFGYQSLHYVVKIPAGWSTVPTFRGCTAYCAEIQIRTLAQHIWAMASHHLQYKQESSVPIPVRRSIHRVSALLETVDLELERVLVDRESYLSSPAAQDPNVALNVDVLARITDELLPPENKYSRENYGELLQELQSLQLDTPSKVEDFIDRNLAFAIKKDREIVNERVAEKSTWGTNKNRNARGVYFTHLGLVRTMFENEFGATKALAVIEARRGKKKAKRAKAKKP